MNRQLLFLMMVMTIGCEVHSGRTPALQPRPARLEEARLSFQSGEYYRARKIVEKLLEEDSADSEAQQLAAEILDAEIAMQKEAFNAKAPEEYNDGERDAQAKTWLERAEMLLSLGQAEQAVLAAEKVFLYDPDNSRASDIVDRGRAQLMESGNNESLFVKQVYQYEMDERVLRYHEQAERWIEQGRWGAARLALEKIMLLDPSDKKAQKLYSQLQDEKEGA